MSDETRATQYVMGTIHEAADRFTELVGEIVHDPKQEFTDDDFGGHPFETAQIALYDADRTARKARVANHDVDLIDAIYAIEDAIDHTEQALDVCPGGYTLILEREVLNELQTARERAYGYVVTHAHAHADPASAAPQPTRILDLIQRPESALDSGGIEQPEQLDRRSEHHREGHVMLGRTKRKEWNERRQLWYRGFTISVRTYREHGKGIPTIVAEFDNPPDLGGLVRRRAILHWVTGGLFGPDLDTLEPWIIDAAKDAVDRQYKQDDLLSSVGKSAEYPSTYTLAGMDGSYRGTVELGFRSATYPLRWLPALLNPSRRRAARKAQHDLRFQRTPEGGSGTDRLRLLSRKDCWTNVRRGVAEAVFEFDFRVTAPHEHAVRRYLEWGFAPVPDRIEITDIERTDRMPTSTNEAETGFEANR